MENQEKIQGQNVSLFDRNKIVVTGISSVDSFDENGISATTQKGTVVNIEGQDLTITDVNLEKGAFEAVGNVVGIFYDDVNKNESKSFLKTLFKGNK